MKPTLRQIEVFRTVMMTGHVTHAADVLGSSQPTVSREIAAIERALDMKLFDRVRGRLGRTTRGTALLEEVERSYVGLDRIAAVAAGLRDFAEGRITVACVPALAHAILPQAIRRFASALPRASVSITTLDSPRLERELSEQRFDLGLVEVREAPAATTIRMLLGADEVAVLPAGHPLLARQQLHPRDFAAQPFVSLAPDDPYRRLVDSAFAEAKVDRVMAIDSDSAVAVCTLVKQGLGVGIVNPLTAMALANEDLHLRTLSFSIPFRIGLVVPTLRASNPLVESFESTLFQAAKGLKSQLKALARA